LLPGLDFSFKEFFVLFTRNIFMKIAIGILITAVLMVACSNDKQEQQKEKSFQYQEFSDQFKTVTAPYQLSDTALLNNKDTAQVRDKAFSDLMPDSVSNKLFGKNARVKYMPLGKMLVPGAETYYIVKAIAGSKKAALLFSFDKEHNFGAVFPFLIPDAEPSTIQLSIIDKAYSISRNVFRKLPNDIVAEGKDVYVYNNDARDFTLIMTDVLDERSEDLINPIDTFPALQKWTGDYIKDKRNIVSVRDGRKPNSLLVFIHFEKKKGQCNGELKGDAEMSGPNTAVYRQGGDPCVLQLTFTNNSVKLNEIEGCGSRRGLECSFDGTFKRKKADNEKTGGKTKKTT
jgi:hypothetical protein